METRYFLVRNRLPARAAYYLPDQSHTHMIINWYCKLIYVFTCYKKGRAFTCSPRGYVCKQVATAVSALLVLLPVVERRVVRTDHNRVLDYEEMRMSRE